MWARTAGLAGVVCHITNCRCLSLKGTPTRENSNNILCDWTSSLQENNVLDDRLTKQGGQGLEPAEGWGGEEAKQTIPGHILPSTVKICRCGG